MADRARKYMINVSSFVPPDSGELFDEIEKMYCLKYLGVYARDGNMCIYIQFENRIAYSNVQNIFKDCGIQVVSISVCKKFIGDDILSEKGKRPKPGGSSKRKRKASDTPNITNTNITNNTTNNDNSVNNNINLIIVNPIGKESLEHITPEFIQKLLSEHHGPDVVFRFGTKMYSLQENMNFKTDLKSGYISGRLEQDGAWETHRKNDGFGMLMDNLKDKNEQAVLKHMESLPYEDLLKFEKDMGWIHEHKYSGLQEDVPVYNKFVKEGFNLLTANMADKVRRIERDGGKKVKLV